MFYLFLQYFLSKNSKFSIKSDFMISFGAILCQRLRRFVYLFLGFSLQTRNFLFLLPIYTLNVLLTSKLNNDWTDHIPGRRSNSPFSPKITIECSKQRNSDLQHFEKLCNDKDLQQCNLIVWDECTMAHKKNLWRH